MDRRRPLDESAAPTPFSPAPTVSPERRPSRPSCLRCGAEVRAKPEGCKNPCPNCGRSEEHTSELQSRLHLVCRLLLEKKKTSPADAGESPRLRHDERY